MGAYGICDGMMKIYLNSYWSSIARVSTIVMHVRRLRFGSDSSGGFIAWVQNQWHVSSDLTWLALLSIILTGWTRSYGCRIDEVTDGTDIYGCHVTTWYIMRAIRTQYTIWHCQAVVLLRLHVAVWTDRSNQHWMYFTFTSTPLSQSAQWHLIIYIM